MSEDDWITTTEAARISGYNAEYVRRLMRSGKVESRKFGTLWQISRRSLLDYLHRAKDSGDMRSGPRA